MVTAIIQQFKCVTEPTIDSAAREHFVHMWPEPWKAGINKTVNMYRAALPQTAGCKDPQAA